MFINKKECGGVGKTRGSFSKLSTKSQETRQNEWQLGTRKTEQTKKWKKGRTLSSESKSWDEQILEKMQTKVENSVIFLRKKKNMRKFKSRTNDGTGHLEGMDGGGKREWKTNIVN